MRFLVALLAMSAPAMAHPGGLHLHEADGFWVAAAAFGVGVALSVVPVVKAARAKR